MSKTYDSLSVPNLSQIDPLYLESSLVQEKGDFNDLQLETVTVGELDSLLERVHTQCLLDLDAAMITYCTTCIHPEGLKELPKLVPLRGLHHENEPGLYVPDVPLQTVSPHVIMLRATSTPTPDTPNTQHPSSSSGELATSLGARKAEPKKKLASTRKVTSVSRPRKTSSLKDKSKPKRPPVPSPRSKLSKVMFKADTKNSIKPRPMDPAYSSLLNAQSSKKAQHEDVEMEDEDEEYVPTPKASPRKNGCHTRIVTSTKKVQTMILETSAAASTEDVENGVAVGPGEISHDVSDIAPWGKPKSDNDRIIEKILAIAKKNWYLIKRQDGKTRAKQKVNLTGKVPCVIPGCQHRSLNNACMRKHLCAHFPNSAFCPVCLRAFSRECSFARHASGPCRARLVEEFALDGPGSANNHRWFNLYFLGLRDDVEMPDQAFHLLAGRFKHDPLYV